MPKYTVSIPIAGAIHIEVEAGDAAAAEERAWDRLNAEPADQVGEIEWEFFDRITEGNVLHAPLNEVEVTRHREEKKP